MNFLSNTSIAIRLAGSALFWSFTILLVSGIILVALYREATERAFDRRMLVYVTALAADLAAGENEQRAAPAAGDPYFDLPLSGWYWQVSQPGQSLRDLRTSLSLIGSTLPALDATAEHDPETGIRRGYAIGPDDRMLRIVERDITLGGEEEFVVAVAGPDDEIASDVRSFSIAITVTFGLLGIALALSTLLQIRFGLRPLKRLRTALISVRSGEVERIPGDYPQDIAPLASEINLLISSNRDILERARTQVGNLAHALKTPLSVLTNEARARPGPLAEIVEEQSGIMRDQITYYLDRARAAALAGTLGTVTPVAPVVEGLARTFAKIYRDKDLDIEIEGVADEMLGNLLDNACKWAAGRVVVTAAKAGQGGHVDLRVSICDDGPGVDGEEQRSEMLKRGRRLDESKPGSGLGLSIVSDLAALYRGRLRLEKAAIGGLQAVLELPGEAG